MFSIHARAATDTAFSLREGTDVGGRPVGRWSVWSRISNGARPDITPGCWLLWAMDAVGLGHSTAEQQLNAGDMALIDGTATFTVTGDHGGMVRLLDLGRRGVALQGDVQDRQVPPIMDGGAPLAILIKDLWMAGHAFDHVAPVDTMVDTRLTDLIGDLVRKLSMDGRENRLSSHQAAIMARAEAQIALHFADPAFSASTLADHMRVTQRHLSALYAAAGTTTTKAILAHRLSRARTLLSDPASRQRQIVEIARLSGFEDQNYFTRCFRRAEGETPREFRKRLRNSIKQNDL